MYGQAYGTPAYQHSTVSSGASEGSPTVALVRYLIDTAHEKLPADNLASHATGKVLLNAASWLKVADEELIEEDYDRAVNPPILEQAAPIIADLINLIPGALSLHSLVINWSDRDSDQGTFGTTVRAWNHTHAEYLARAEMEASEDAGSDFDGSIVDHNIGATWLADELEQALRGLVAHFGPMAATDNEAMAKAKALLTRIDGTGV